MKRYALLLCFLMDITNLANVLAEEQSLTMSPGERGRLSDGRAYRTDENGNQLVDYIAELELNIETLTRKLQALEQGSREPKLFDAESGEELAERDLVKSTEPKLFLDDVGNESPKDLNIAKDCSLELNALADLKVKLNERDNQINNLAIQLEKSSSEVQLLKTNNKNLGIEKDTLKKQLINVNNTKAIDISEARASLKTKAIGDFRTSIQGEINKAKELIITREKLYKTYSEATLPIKFEPQKPVTKDNLSLDDLQKELKKSESMRRLSEISREVNQIKSMVSEDLALLQRLNRLQ